MLFVMNEALVPSESETEETRKPRNDNSTSVLTLTPPAARGLIKAPPPSSPSSSSDGECDDCHSIRSGNRPMESRFDVEASETSTLMEDESLQDIFGESDETELTPTRGATSRLKVSLHNSLSALQNARSGIIHRQSSVSSLPITMDDSNRMRKRASIATTGMSTFHSSSTSVSFHSSNTSLQASQSKALHWTAATAAAAATKKTEEKEHRTSHDHTRKPTHTPIHKKKKSKLPSYTLLFLTGLLFVTTGLYYHSHSSPYWFYITTHARRAARQKPFLEVLLQQEGILGERLMDPDSPAFRAMDWLANDDSLKLSPNHQGMIQRWAVAVVYFATDQSPWKNQTNWLSHQSVCDWYGVECEILSESDWFDVALGTRNSASDATQALGSGGGEPDAPAMDVVRLDLSNNGLMGTLPVEIQLLSQLMRLDLSHNRLSGSLPQGDALGHYLRLTDLRLSYNHLTGELPVSIGYNMILKHLELDHNFFRGTIPEVWGLNLRNLRNWTLQQNFLTGTIPTTIGGMKHIERLEWSENQFTGFLPFAICKLSTLKSLQLQFNSIEGLIPPEFIMSAKNLQVLDLGHNHFTGQIPDVMDTSFAAPNLHVLHVSNNDLSGRLPKTLGHLASLTSLQFDHNHFTGWIPVDWHQLEGLEVLRLHDNKLGGTIPSQLSHLTNLQEFQFQNNLLHPMLPDEILMKLSNLHYHSVGFYTSDARDLSLDALLASEQSRMRRQQEIMKDEKPSKYDDEEM